MYVLKTVTSDLAPYITVMQETTNSHKITLHDITGMLYMYIGVVIYTYLVCNILIPNIPNYITIYLYLIYLIYSVIDYIIICFVLEIL